MNTMKKRIIGLSVYVALIYLTLPVARPVLNFLYASFGKETLSILINATLLICATLAVWLLFKKTGANYQKRIALAGVLSLWLWIASSYETPEERVHYIEYGLLGYLLVDVTRHYFRRAWLSAFIIAALIGAGDEGIQWLLPNRVGDLRDVYMNVTAGLMGVILSAIATAKKSPDPNPLPLE